MKIFFAGSIRGGRQLISTYEHIIRFLKSHNYNVISEHVASEALEKVEIKMSEPEIFQKDTEWIEESDCMIAEVTVPSIGVGYEICHAVKHHKPVLCVYQKGTKASAMVLGNASVTARQYSDKKQLEEILLNFLEKKEIA
ncbi:MAG: nucleoside 2-deoxyribosyltransferase [Candidatus Methanoperedens sp.]|nr:nucleoside 2-deoxyribosyltransferase [Candidatus Methanoperedens sp.]MCZ7371027.1 nucleoside 2-deoxyribosyltransferase [Candidatus Methanoperedens sp.]